MLFLKLYRLAWKIFNPFIELYLWRRRQQGKEDPYRFDERLGVPSLPRPNSKLVWIHAASVGEAASILPLIEVLLAGNAWIHVMVTTGTVSSAYLMEQRLPKRAFHQYVPIDKQEYVEEFIDYWQPDLAIWVESEFWPNLLMATKQVGIPVILLNGRVSNDSFRRWKRLGSFCDQVLSCFSLVLPQSRDDSRKLKAMGAENIRFLGNLKYGAPALPYDVNALVEFKKMIGNRMVWVAASTHAGEEEEILRAHLKIKEKIYTVLTIIVPRHPQRGREIYDMASTAFNVSLRSNNDKILEDTEVYIADSLGELGLFYRVAPIVFVGGSLVERGGHNPIEPANLDSAIIVGENMQNFKEVVLDFMKAGAITEVGNAEELAAAVFELWHNPQKRVAMSMLAEKHVRQKAEILPNIIDEIEAFL